MTSQIYKFLFTLLLSVFLCACTASLSLKKTSPEDREWLLSGAPLYGEGFNELNLPDDNFLHVSEEMARFITSQQLHRGAGRARLRSFLKAVIGKDSIGIVYDPSATYTAEDTFKHRRGNCLSFTTMVVSMARQMGLNAYFNEVDVPAIWDLHDNSTLVLYKHINAVVDFRYGHKQVIDIDMEGFDTSYQQRIISDRLADAQYYNNRAMEYLREKDIKDAYRYLLKAISLEPNVSYFWNNMGSLYRRSGNLQAAEISYRIALEISPNNYTAISNAARLYADLGQVELAKQLREKAEYFRNRNPYYLYKKGLDAFFRKNYASAMEYIIAAIRRYPKEHRFHFLKGVIHYRTGEIDLAEQSLQKAIDITTDIKQNGRYRRKMELLLSASKL